MTKKKQLRKTVLRTIKTHLKEQKEKHLQWKKFETREDTLSSK
ncbi:hypothetical protein [Calidifontibacillus erzurumensis]|nr:hypothetical protein [Calidifontibacillus erzurumensis]